jgi:hypothetical protein
MNRMLNPSVYQVKHGRFEVLHLWYRKQGIDKLVNEPKHEKSVYIMSVHATLFACHLTYL